MNHELKKIGYRGVFCFRCRQPIPLPAAIVGRESTGPEELGARVFALRCRTCHKESIYMQSDFVECEGVPRARIFHSRARAS